MKKLAGLFLLFALVLPIQSALAQSGAEDNAGAVVCVPDVYMQTPADCLPLGPSEYLTRMAQLGMTIPLQPLPANSTDPGLKDLPYNYYKVNSDTGTGFYPSP